MKTSITLIALFAMTLTSFTTINRSSGETRFTSAAQLGEKIISALNHQSVTEYTSLFPTLQEFHLLMDHNAPVYGPYLPEAKRDFEQEYRDVIIPAVAKSFEEILKTGTEKGISWSEVKFESADFDLANKTGLSVPGIVSFSYNGQVHHLRIEKAILLDNNWKVGQYLHLN
jgi:hypothetical protein